MGERFSILKNKKSLPPFVLQQCLRSEYRLRIADPDCDLKDHKYNHIIWIHDPDPLSSFQCQHIYFDFHAITLQVGIKLHFGLVV